MFQIRLNRPDSSYPWGFRLEGGSDLPIPLQVQRVKPNSLAERAGLQPNDVIISINNTPASHMRHDQAKMEIIRSCNEIAMTIQRGGGVAQPVHQQENTIHVISQNHNSYNGGSGGMQSGPGAYNSPPAVRPSSTNHNYTSAPVWSIGTSHNAIPPPFSSGGGFDQGSGFRSVASPRAGRWATPPSHHAYTDTVTGHVCGMCGEDIHGTYVKVQNRVPMHPHCMVCCYCGVNLKNRGYFCIRDRLYCDIHATHA